MKGKIAILLTFAILVLGLGSISTFSQSQTTGTVEGTVTDPNGLVTSDATVVVKNIDTGAETLSVRPRDALPIIEGHGRTPLTIDEGVAVLAQFPEVLRTHNAYQLLASRRDDKRIPSIWTSYKQPRLGWCWEGNPHSWLGMASAGGRA